MENLLQLVIKQKALFVKANQFVLPFGGNRTHFISQAKWMN